jgi:hypothetical protein
MISRKVRWADYIARMGEIKWILRSFTEVFQLHVFYSIDGRMIFNDDLKKIMERRDVICLRYCPRIILERLGRKPIKPAFRIVDFRTEIRTEHLPNKKQEC